MGPYRYFSIPAHAQQLKKISARALHLCNYLNSEEKKSYMEEIHFLLNLRMLSLVFGCTPAQISFPLPLVIYHSVFQAPLSLENECFQLS